MSTKFLKICPPNKRVPRTPELKVINSRHDVDQLRGYNDINVEIHGYQDDYPDDMWQYMLEIIMCADEYHIELADYGATMCTGVK